MRPAAVPASTFVVALIAVTCSCGRGGNTASNDENDGALYLTPMIRDGRTEEARAACAVTLPVRDGMTSAAVEQNCGCAGYLTVDEPHDSNLFFWFFPAASGAPDAPVLLWLQGGPGAPSLYSVFNEHGPFTVDDAGVLERRRHAWTSALSVLYVDNPVGTGYSFTRDDAGYSTNQTAVGHNLYTALVQFFALFREYRDNVFYVAGESYAGKYVPAVSNAIHLNNPRAAVRINLKGLAIGNGLIDPANQMVYSEFLFQLGLVDEDGKRRFGEKEKLTRDRIAEGDFRAAYRAMAEMVVTMPSLYFDLTRIRNVYNVLWNSNPIPFEGGHWDRFVQEPKTRDALHVGRRTWSAVDAVYERLMYDIPRSVGPWLAALLDDGRYRVLLYSGQLDVIVPYRGTMNVAKSLQWTGAERFRNATRTVWRVPSPSCRHPQSRCNDAVVAGYATASGPLTVLLVRNAGHMVPYDQPAWAHDLITTFTSGKSF